MLKKMYEAVELKMIGFSYKMAKRERGDTNFISIIIILGIVIVLAGVFLMFKDQIVGKIKGLVDNLDVTGSETGNVNKTPG